MMLVWKACVTVFVFGVVAAVANLVFAVDVPLSETKDQLQLQYEVTAEDLGNGRIDFALLVSDAGQLQPLDSIDLVITSGSRCGGGNELSLSLATVSHAGKISTHVVLSRELAARAEFRLRNFRLNVDKEPYKFYYHSIALAAYLDAARGIGQPAQGQ